MMKFYPQIWQIQEKKSAKSADQISSDLNVNPYPLYLYRLRFG